MKRLRPSHSFALWLLSLALLYGQGLGQWHRVAHAGPAGLGSTQHAHAQLGHSHAETAAAVAPAHDAFGHDADDSAECRLFDQISVAESLPSAPSVCVAAAIQETPAHVRAVLCEGRPLRPYQARAPPRV